MTKPPVPNRAVNANRRLAFRLVGVVVVMASLSFIAVPFYSWFCRVTGYGGTTQVAEQAPDEVLDRMITVRFDANVAKDMPWQFRPMQREMKVRIGETGLAFYEFENLSDQPIAGTASFNVTPFSAGSYFDKIACFCFELQELAPGEKVEMPVSFFVDPEMLQDAEAKGVRNITLSYTMYPADPSAGPKTPVATASLSASQDADKAIEN